MTEDLDSDLDSDLEDLAGDLNLDDADAGGDDVSLDDADLDLGDTPAAETSDAGGEEGVTLDDDLQSMMDDSGEEGGGGDEDILGGGGDEDILGGGGDEDILGGGGDEDILGGGDLPAEAQETAPSLPALSEGETINLEFLLDIKLHVTFEVGRSKMLISDLLTLGQGSVIELHRLVGDELDLLINGRLVAKGEVIVLNEKFGCKITSIIPPEERVKHLAVF